jgi:hypothetical protein
VRCQSAPLHTASESVPCRHTPSSTRRSVGPPAGGRGCMCRQHTFSHTTAKNAPTGASSADVSAGIGQACACGTPLRGPQRIHRPTAPLPATYVNVLAAFARSAGEHRRARASPAAASAAAGGRRRRRRPACLTGVRSQTL